MARVSSLAERAKARARPTIQRQMAWDAGPLVLLLLVTAASAGPALERFDLDLSTGTLALTFDEEMSDTTGDIDWTGVSLRTHVNGLEGSGVTLWSTEGESGWGDPVSTDSEFALEVEIHPTDLDEMKALSIGHNSSFTWITLRKGAFEAQYGGELNDPVFGTQVVGSNGFSVSTLTQDSTSPTLERFTVGSAGRQLVLFFSEGVAYSSLKQSELSLFYDDGSFRNATLSCASAARGREGSWREIVLTLDEPCATVTTNATLSNGNRTSSGGNASFAFVGGFASDWDMLVQVGLVQDVGGDESYSEETGQVRLRATSAFVTDLSAAANALIAVAALEESPPDCQPCGDGTYRSLPCTEVYDAKCSLCTEGCQEDHFALSPCNTETDLDCHRCTPCPFGTREVGGCDQSSDRVCDACSECVDGEYESRGCSAGGEDRICETCLRCSMPSEVAEACRDSRLVLPWQLENCCETVEGEKLPCADVLLENLRVSAREGRRHWVFDPSIPSVEGYTQLFWGQGPVARDAVVPKDQLIEVDFREGARSVFDDPRYVGQEGPTGRS